MTTNEETIAMGGEKKEVKKSNASREWKNVAIGGVTGIMFGAGTAYAAGKLSDGNETAEEGNNAGTGVHDVAVDASDVATVSEGQSFGEAFAQARAEVGSGGVFRWHGGVYGTYTKDEWDAMSPEEQRQFSQNAMSAAGTVSEGGTGSVDTAHVEHHTQGGNVHHAQAENTSNGPVNSPTAQQETGSHGNTRPISGEDNDVRVVGVHDEQLDDGTVVTVGTLEGTGADTEIMVVDLDRDSVFDVAVSDLNSNGRLDEGEIADISGAGLRVPDAVADPNQQTAQNEDLAPGMPDYMSDADVQLA